MKRTADAVNAHGIVRVRDLRRTGKGLRFLDKLVWRECDIASRVTWSNAAHQVKSRIPSNIEPKEQQDRNRAYRISNTSKRRA